MKIIVTGGAGFIASHIVDRLVEIGHKVIIIDNFSTGKKENVNKKAVLMKIDIRNKEDIEKIFVEFKPDVLYHHAAQLDVRKSVADPAYYAEVNLLGLINLLEAGRKNNLKKIIFASSGGVVYGDSSILPTPEDYHPLQPLSPYGVTKLASENYLYYYFKAYNLPYLALRYANVYGPRQDPFGEAGVVAIFTQRLLKKENPVINGDGEQTRDYVFVKDVVEANIKCLDSSFVGALNIGTGIETSVNKLYEILASLTDFPAKEIHGQAKVGEQKRSVLSNTKAKSVLNWIPTWELMNGLKETVDYFRNIDEQKK